MPKTDNAELIIMRDALDLLRNRLAKVIWNLSSFAMEWKGVHSSLSSNMVVNARGGLINRLGDVSARPRFSLLTSQVNRHWRTRISSLHSEYCHPPPLCAPFFLRNISLEHIFWSPFIMLT